jgi:hypothetical protein
LAQVLRGRRDSLQTFAAILPWSSSVFIPSFVGAMLACIGIATYFDDAIFFFWCACVFAFLGLVWGVGYWITSDKLEERKRTQRPYIGLAVVVTMLIMAAFTVSIAFIRVGYLKKRLQSYSDYIVPGSDPTPFNACTWLQSVTPPTGKGYPNSTSSMVPKDALLVLLGPLSAMATQFPDTVISINGESILTMDKDSSGAVSVSMDVYDKDHDIVAIIDKNSFQVASSVFKFSRDNRLSDLRVIIRHDKEEVLHIRYINPHAISITGVFHTKTDTLRVNANAVYLNDQIIGIQHVCSGGNNFPDFQFRSRPEQPQ